MGLADALGQDPRVELKTVEYAGMIAKNVRGKIIEDALAAGIPGDQIMQVLNAEVVRKEERELLAAYKETGLTPDQIYEIDKEYTALSQKLAELKAEHEGILGHVKTLKEELGEVRKERDHFAEQMRECATPEENDGPDPQQADKKKETTRKPRTKLDTGKVMALHNAGWKPAAIAEEMGVTSKAVSQVIYRMKQKGTA